MIKKVKSLNIRIFSYIQLNNGKQQDEYANLFQVYRTNKEPLFKNQKTKQCIYNYLFEKFRFSS